MVDKEADMKDTLSPTEVQRLATAQSLIKSNKRSLEKATAQQLSAARQNQGVNFRVTVQTDIHLRQARKDILRKMQQEESRAMAARCLKEINNAPENQ